MHGVLGDIRRRTSTNTGRCIYITTPREYLAMTRCMRPAGFSCSHGYSSAFQRRGFIICVPQAGVF